MTITTSEKYNLFTATASFDVFTKEFENIFTEQTAKNLILDLSNIEVSENQIKTLQKFAEEQTENQQSFVVITSLFDADFFEEELNVVPTLTEAEDMIDMDEMTRDLGF